MNEGKFPSAIVDIDGTIADVKHRLAFLQEEPKDWEGFHKNCDTDEPIIPTIRLVNALSDSNWQIILVTGRGGENREMTETWLDKHDVQRDMLLMRQPGNFEPDVELKKRWLHMFRDGRLGLWNTAAPSIAIEDRKSVTDMWREQGLVCLQCAEGEF
jgi:hypothetical protein